MAKQIPSNFYIPQRPEQGESEQAFFNRVRAGSRAGVSALTGGISHGVDDLQNFFEQYGSDDATLRRLMAQTPPSGESATSGGNMQLAQLLTFGAPGTGGNAFLTDFAGAPANGAQPQTAQQQYGGILTLPNGQRIHPDDPNYATYAQQLGVQKQTQPPIPSDTAGIISSTNDPYKTAISDAITANKAGIDAITALPATLPPATPQTPNLPQVPQTPALGLTGDVYTEEGKQAKTALETRRIQLESEKLEEEQSIKGEFANQRAETERVLNANLEYGKALMAGRGILPATNSQYLQWYTETTSRNQQALNGILVAERRALLDAQKAYNNADFELVDRQLALGTQMRERADKIQMWQTDNEFKKADLQLKMAEFEAELGFKADELNLKQMDYALDRARELRASGRDQAEIATMVQREIREEAEFDRSTMIDVANSLAFEIKDLTDEEEANKYLQEVADLYGYDVGILGGFVNEKLTSLIKEEDEPITEQVGDNLLQYNPETKEWDVVFKKGTTGGAGGIGDLFAGAKLTTGQKNDVADMLVLQKQIQALKKLKETYGGYIGAAGGGLGSLKSLAAKVTGITTPGAQEMRNTIGQIKGFIAKLRGGTSFTPNEQRLLDTYTPGINDSDKVIDSKLNSLTQYVNDKLESVALVAGGSYTPPESTNEFSIEDPNGMTHSFSSQDELDEFKRRTGL